MTHPAASDGPLDFRPLLDGVLDLAKRYPIPLLLPLALLGLLGSGDGGGRGRDDMPWDRAFTGDVGDFVWLPAILAFLGVIALIALIVIVLLVILHAIVWLVTANGALTAIEGGTPDLGASWRAVKGDLGAGIGAFLLYALIVLVGFVLLVVPGIFLAAALAPWPAVLVAERKGAVDSLRRAWALTENHRTPLFLLVLAAMGISLLASLVLGWIPILGGPIAGAISGALLAGYVILGALFYKRRVGHAAPSATPGAGTPPTPPPTEPTTPSAPATGPEAGP